jgi:hypothetical protein
MENLDRSQSGGGARITMLDEIEKARRAGGAFSELPLHDDAGNSEIKPPRQNTQIKFHDPAEFDTEIALALAASHWRTAALFLHLTAKYAEAGDYLSLDRNRRRAREQFLEGNLVYKQLQEARAAAAWIGAEAFRDIEPIDRGRRAAEVAGMSVLPIDSAARP